MYQPIRCGPKRTHAGGASPMIFLVWSWGIRVPCAASDALMHKLWDCKWDRPRTLDRFGAHRDVGARQADKDLTPESRGLDAIAGASSKWISATMRS